MGAAADLGRQGPRVLRDHGTGVTIPRSSLHRLSEFHDPSVMIGREMTGHTGPTACLGAIGQAVGPAASMIFGQAETHPHGIKAILLATLGR
jgi:hypothetical protein